MIGPDTMMYISSFDLDNNVLTPICNYWMGDNVANTNLTSPLEFLSSDPECDLLIDLDRDNSTGVYPYDYLDSTDYCTTLEAPICDPDVYIHASAPLDSIVLIISGIQEPGDEQLILSGLPTGITFIQKNDSTYILISSDPADSIYQKALLAIRYLHSGSQRTPGPRRIILQGFNAIKDGVLITANLHISRLPFAGDDATLLICTDTLIQDLSSITDGQPGGYWSPLLSGGGNAFDSQVDQASTYQYVIIDPVCGNDTAVVSINRDASAPVDLLGDDQVLCAGDTMEVTISQNALNILWDDGSTDTSRELSLAGTYWVVLETSGGCTYADSLLITEGQIWNPSIQTKDPICNLSNGQITIDPIEFQQHQSILINGALINSPNLGSLTEGIYDITAVSIDGCVTNTSVSLTNQPILSIAVDTQTIVIQDLWEAVEYIEQNNVLVADILFDPAAYIRWTGSEIEIFGDQDTPYEITFVDENGCTDVHVLNVLVEKAQGIYLPNIFSPSSIAGNDVWTPSISEHYALEVLRIYDRWGNMVYQSTTDATWDGSKDGKECQTGVFVYQLILKHMATGERKVMMGDITLIR
ncbi:MAG TPA: gliding motility-associated C-terminal domain-containing protein [Saprospiraceae bacterium]|nr:gliding motility-associated C-terminal domain-containing protein [Saprospiraceae bacterium]